MGLHMPELSLLRNRPKKMFLPHLPKGSDALNSAIALFLETKPVFPSQALQGQVLSFGRIKQSMSTGMGGSRE